MLKTTRSPNKLVSNRNNGSRSASSRNNNNKSASIRNNNSKPASEKNDSNSKFDRFGIHGNIVEYAKKSRKSKGKKLAKS